MRRGSLAFSWREALSCRNSLLYDRTHRHEGVKSLQHNSEWTQKWLDFGYTMLVHLTTFFLNRDKVIYSVVLTWIRPTLGNTVLDKGWDYSSYRSRFILTGRFLLRKIKSYSERSSFILTSKVFYLENRDFFSQDESTGLWEYRLMITGWDFYS